MASTSLFQRLLGYGRVTSRPGPPPQASPYTLWLQQRDVPEDLALQPDQQIAVSTVHACIRAKSEDVGRAPWKVYTIEKGRKVFQDEDPLNYLLNVRPNPDMTAKSFWTALLVQTFAHGDGYAEIVKDQAGRVKELRVIPTVIVQPTIANGGELLASYPPRPAEPREMFFKIATTVPAGMDISYVNLPQDQVFHVSDFPTVDGSRSDSTLARAAKAIAVSYAMERYSLNYFANNAQFGGILKPPPGKQLSVDEQKAVMAEWNAKNPGVGNAFKLLITNADFQPMTANAEQAQIIQARQFMVAEICRYFRVPLHKVQDHPQSAPGRSGEMQNIDYVRDALRPITACMQQEAEAKLFTQRAPWKKVLIDLSEYTQGDELSRAQAADIWVSRGIKTINEIRNREDMNHIANGEQDDLGDIHFVSGPMVPLTDEVPEPAPLGTDPNSPDEENPKEDKTEGGVEEPADKKPVEEPAKP